MYKRISLYLIMSLILMTSIFHGNNVFSEIVQLKGHVYIHDYSFEKREPLPDAYVTPKGYSSINTESDGGYTIAVEGHESLEIQYGKDGYNDTTRSIVLADLKEKILDDVALVKKIDPNSNEGYTKGEIIHLAKTIVAILLIDRPGLTARNNALSVRDEILKSKEKNIEEAIKAGAPIFYNIYRLVDTNKWFKKEINGIKFYEAISNNYDIKAIIKDRAY